MATPVPATRPEAKIRAINCPNCGSAVELRGFGSALHAVCPSCTSVLDVSHPLVQVVQRFRQQTEYRQPLIPLGSRGRFDGHKYEAIGFQVRGITADGIEYTWDEYVLFNPYQGFRYLTVYDGHWNLVDPIDAVPSTGGWTGSMLLQYGGQSYKMFQVAEAHTLFILGEFPWRAKKGDTVKTEDYVCPPFVLSAEKTGNEVTWSHGRYLSGQEVFSAFEIRQTPPEAKGVYSNQPNPYPAASGLWLLLFLFSGLMLAAMLVTTFMARNERAFEGNYYFMPGSGEASFVTPVFDLKGGEKNVEVEVETDLRNDWAAFNFALINDQTGTAYDFGTEVSYYTGRDSDGTWTEGNTKNTIRVGGVPGGKYYLRIEPEMEAPKTTGIFAGSKRVNYTVRLRRDVPVIWPYFVLWPLLLIPPIWASWRRASFETRRWAESDVYGSAGENSAAGDGSDDDD